MSFFIFAGLTSTLGIGGAFYYKNKLEDNQKQMEQLEVEKKKMIQIMQKMEKSMIENTRVIQTLNDV